MPGVLHTEPDLRVLLKWMIAGSGSVITDVIQPKRKEHPVAISSKWKAKDAYEASWSVAQIRAPFSDVVSALMKSRSYKDSKQSGADSLYNVTNEDRAPLVVYETVSKDWTFLEAIWGAIDFGPLTRLSKTANTDLLVADYCHDPCGMGYGHFKNGRLVENFMSMDPEWPETRGLDGKEKKWKINSLKTQGIFGKRESDLDIETDHFADWWSDVSDSLSLTVPFRCWTAWKDDDNVGADKSEVPDVANAHLFNGK